MNKDHDYRDTIKQAAGTSDDARRAEDIDEKLDDEMMFEAMAINGSMGMLGMEQTNANLLQLELAQEIMADIDNGVDRETDEYQPFD